MILVAKFIRMLVIDEEKHLSYYYLNITGPLVSLHFENSSGVMAANAQQLPH